MDIRLALMCGTDIPIVECGIILHQPTIKEIAWIGEDTFFTGAQTLNINKNIFDLDNFHLQKITNFQIFMTLMAEKTLSDKKEAVIQVLKLIFPDMKVMFTPRTLVFQKEGQEPVIIDDSNFSFLQKVIKEVFCLNSQNTSQQGFNPADKKAKEIAEKLMRGRQRVAAQKGDQSASIFSQYVSTLTVGIKSMSIQDCLNLTMYQLFDLMDRYSLYTSWDIDVRSRLAGAKIDSEPENWMKNIH